MVTNKAVHGPYGLPTVVWAALQSLSTEVIRMPKNSNANDDNRANQLNPNNDAYWQSRGYDEKPDDWQQRIDEDEEEDDEDD